jgi:DNA topoisomerase IB
MMRHTIAKEEIDPDQYHEEHGKCPRGYTFDGEKCVKTAPAPEDEAKGPDEPEEAPEGPEKGAEKPKQKAPKKPKIVPQGPVQDVTPDNPYGLAESARLAKTAADIGGHEGLRKILGHMEPSKYPPPDVDPSKAMMQWRDTKGRLQAAYTPRFLNRNAAVKWERVKGLESKAEGAVKAFGDRMQDTSLSDRDRDAAAIMAIIGKTGLRPGSASGLKSTGHRGISTLAADNVKVEGDQVSLEFVGKSGKTNRTTVKDPALAQYLGKRLKGKEPGELLFEAREKDLPGAMEAAGVGNFKPKDFRTRKAGQIAAQVMSDLDDPPPPLPAEPNKAKRLVEQRIKEASTAVADQLNNTPAMARKAYINPAIFRVWAEAVGASQYLQAAMARKPTADELWEKALDVTLPDADKPVEVEPELQDDDQLDSVPEPTFKDVVEAASYWGVEQVVAGLVGAGHLDLTRRLLAVLDR